MNFRRFFATSLLLIACAVLLHRTSAQAPSSPDERRKAFDALLSEQWEYTMRENPEFATIVGDYRYNDRWSDQSLAHIARQDEDSRNFLARFEAIDTTGFPEQEQLSDQLMVRGLKEDIEGYGLKTFEMPLNQFTGAHLQLAEFAAIVPYDSVKHYEDFIARLNSVPVVMNQLIEVLRQGQKDHLMPPRFLLQKVVSQCRSIGDAAGEQSAFAQGLNRFPSTIGTQDRKRLHDALIAAIDTKVRPAYASLGSFVETTYAPAGRLSEGLWSLPNGDALYRYSIRTLTTTNRDPEDIHQLGLQQVDEIEKEQTQIAQRLGAKDLKSFRESLKTNPKNFATSREQILDLYRKYIAQMNPQLPKLFGLLPKADLEVVPVEQFREKEASAAEYVEGTPDGSRPGKVYVNTGDFQHRTVLNIESTAYHEGIPGHHMQISIAQELPELPPFRKHAFYSAYIEGWALYAERLGKEVGFYQDPYSDFGRLNDELLRACRLVLDTGVHAKHWTREQMVEFFRQHSGEDEPNIQAETDRYIAWPAQALGYKLGQLEFLELRERARQRLGAKFDIRAFHDEMLNGGPLPLDVLAARTDRWLAAQASAKPAP